MKFLNIVKDGIDNVVDEALYEAVYKPVGWKIVGESDGEAQTPPDPADEIKMKNTNRMKRVSAKQFDDKLIKEESEQA